MDEVSQEEDRTGSDKVAGQTEQVVKPSAVKDQQVPSAGPEMPENTNTGDETEQMLAPLIGSVSSAVEAATAGRDKQESGGIGTGSDEQGFLAGSLGSAVEAGAGSVQRTPLAGADKKEAETGAGSNTRPRQTSRPLSIDAPEFQYRQSFVPPTAASRPVHDSPASFISMGTDIPDWSGNSSPSHQQQQQYYGYSIPPPGFAYQSGPPSQSFQALPPQPQMSMSPMSSRQDHWDGELSPHPAPSSSGSGSGFRSGSGSGSRSRRNLSVGWKPRSPNLLSPISFPPLGSSGTPATLVSSSASGPSLVRFAATVNDATAMEAERQTWETKLNNFLQREDCQSYRDQVPHLGVRLSVDFKDLFLKDMHLGLKLCETQGTNGFWLDPAVKKFFEDNALPSGITGSIEFKGMPASLRSAKEVLKSQPRSRPRSLCGGRKVIYEATEHGRSCMSTILTGILDNLRIGVSFGGTLKLEHMFIGEDEEGNLHLFIAKEPEDAQNPTKNGKILDLRGIWTEVEEFYILADGTLPLYFAQLKNDLLYAAELEPWFIDYLSHHPALYSSLPRRDFLIAFQKICKIQGIPKGDAFASFFSRQPIPGSDWRDIASKSATLRAVFVFRSWAEKRLDKLKRDKEKEKARAEGREPVKTDEVVTGLSHYHNTTESLATYNRNGLEHLDQKVPVQSLDEIELFLAHYFPDLLPDLLKCLLSLNSISREFEEVRNVYFNGKFV